MKSITLTLMLTISLACISIGQNSWSSIASLSGFHSFEAASFSVNGKGYVGTGNINGGGGTQVWEYDPASNTWTQKANFPGGSRSGAFGFSIGNFGYIGGGQNTNQGFNYTDFYQYNSTNNTWIQKASHPGVSRKGAVGFAMNGKGYMGLGTGFPYQTDFYEYNPITDVWTTRSNFPGQGRAWSAGFAICEKGYVGGGYLGVASTVNDFYEFDPINNNWTQKANIPGSGHWDLVGFGICDKGFVTYTNTFNGPNELYEFSISSNSWVKKADYPGVNRTTATVFTIDNKAYVGLGGMSGTLQDMYAYTPNSGNPPPQPGPISGNSSPCSGAVEIYSVSSVSCAESYTWTFPTGTIINSGNGTNSVTVTWGSTPGSISVTADNPCGSSTPRTASVTLLTAPGTPGSISGTTNVCAGSSYTYSVSSVSGATSYTWSLPTGWTGTSSTSSISATAGTAGGQIQITASNACGSSSASTVNVNVVAQTIQLSSAATTNNQTVCGGSPITSIVYAVGGSATGASVTGLPTGVTGSFSGGSFTISGQSGSGGTHAYVVTTSGTCNAVTASGTITIQPNAPGVPSSISGNQTVCAGTNPTFSVTADPNANSYTWALPSGWSGTSATHSINPVVGSSGGVITVTAINACGSSPAQTLNVVVTPFDLSVSNIGNSLQAGQTGAVYQWLNCGSGNSAVPGATGQTFTPTSSGSYSVVVTLNTCSDTSLCIPFTATDIDELSMNGSSILVYPSPAENTLYIQSASGFYGEECLVDICDSQGRKWVSTVFPQGTTKSFGIDVSLLSSGLYIVTVRNEASAAFRAARFVKQ